MFAISLSIIRKFNIIESLFIAIVVIIIVNWTFAKLISFTFATYVIYILCGVSLLLAIGLLIFKKRIFSIRAIVNPSFLIFLIATIAYSFIIVSRDFSLLKWDDLTHWGLAVKAFYVYDGFESPFKILGPQTLALPLFNAFIVKVSGYKDAYLFVGMWIIYWVAALLPISNMGWKQSIKAVGYSIFAYLLIILITHNYQNLIYPTLYGDGMLAIICGNIISYFITNKSISNKRAQLYVVTSSVFLIAQTKRVTGLFFAICVLLIIIIYLYANTSGREQTKKFALYGTLSIVFAELMGRFLKPTYPVFAANAAKPPFANLAGSIAHTLITPIGILLTISIIIFAALYICSRTNKRLKNIWLSITIVSVLSFVIFVFISLDTNSKLLIQHFALNLSRLSIATGKIKFYHFFYSAIIVSLVFYFAIINEKKKKVFLTISIVFAVQFVIYVILLLGAYSRFSEYEALKSASLNRYIESFVFFVVFSFSFVFLDESVITNAKSRRVTSSLVILLFILKFMPTPGALFYAKNPFYDKISVTSGISQRILEEVPLDAERVLSINQGDNGYLKWTVAYNVLPIRADLVLSLGPPKYDGDIWSTDLTPKDFSQYVIENGVDYLAVNTIDQYFTDTFTDMFFGNIKENSVYKVIHINGYVKFEQVN